MEKQEWEQTLKRKKGGALYAHLFNVYTVFANHPDWGGVIGRDESGSVVLLKQQPGRCCDLDFAPGLQH